MSKAIDWKARIRADERRKVLASVLDELSRIHGPNFAEQFINYKLEVGRRITALDAEGEGKCCPLTHYTMPPKGDAYAQEDQAPAW